MLYTCYGIMQQLMLSCPSINNVKFDYGENSHIFIIEMFSALK